MSITNLYHILMSSTPQLFVVFRLLICAPTNSAVDILLCELVNTGLFDKTILRRLLSYTHFISKSFNQDLDDYCALPASDCTYGGSEKREIGIKLS